MKTKTKKGRQSNWITFLFGGLFNVLANMALSSAIHYSLHALVGGIVFLFFKILGDTMAPPTIRVAAALWKRFTAWLKSGVWNLNPTERVGKFPYRNKTPRA